MGVRDERRKRDLERKKQERIIKPKLVPFRYEITLMYDGSNFGGYSKQKHQNTIQNNLENTLEKFFNEEVNTIESSRTDAKVHALNQKVMFETTKVVKEKALFNFLNDNLVDGIKVVQLRRIPDTLHVRHNVYSKTYLYKMHYNDDLFKRNYSLKINAVNVEKMQEAANCLLGEHDFSAFCNTGSLTANHIRTIYRVEFTKVKEGLEFRICGSGFLYNMVRIIVATLLDVGYNKITVEQFNEILVSQNRENASEKVSASGLYLEEILYEKGCE